MADVTVSVSGHGEVKVEIPEGKDEESFSDGVAEGVRATMDLVKPVAKPNKVFDMVLGMRDRNE